MIEVKQGTVSGNVYGGYAENGNVYGNTVKISGTANISGSSPSVFGARTLSGNATNNTIEISGTAYINQNVFGGRSEGMGAVTGNKVIMTGGQVAKDLYGGYVSGDGNATGNIVAVTGGTVTGTIVAGGRSQRGDASGNFVTIGGVASVKNVYGGYADASAGIGKATNNTVTIMGTPTLVNTILYGGYTINVTGSAGDVRSGNTLDLRTKATVNGARNFENWNFTLKNDLVGQTMLATTNAVTLGTGAKVGISVDSASARLNKGNSFVLIDKVADAYASNMVVSAVPTGDVIDLYDFGVSKNAGNALIAQVDRVGRTKGYGGGNSYGINSDHSEFDYIAGGYADGTTYSTATNNTLTISQGAVFDPTKTILYGGYKPIGTGDVRSGNTLKVSALNIRAASIGNFQNFIFYLPSTVHNGDSVLTLSNAVDISTPSGEGATKISISIMGSDLSLKNGDAVRLIHGTGGVIADAGMANVTSIIGISKSYTFKLEINSNALLARVLSGGIADEQIRKSPAEGRAAAAALFIQGADLVAKMGLDNARSASREQRGFTPFFALSGSSLRYHTGSHVNVRGAPLMAGLVRRWETQEAEVVVGGFFETGFGSYDTHNTTAEGQIINGYGSSRYYGGGILSRIDVSEGIATGLYGESSVRIGGINANYHSDDLNPGTAHQASYKIDALYYGAHAGFGHLTNLNDKTGIDLYSKYLWAHTGGGNVTVLGDPVQLKSVNSHRIRFGGRLNYAVNTTVTPHIGGAWEYEFDGTAHSVVVGEDVAAPSMKGSTYIGEMGLTWVPTDTHPLAVDLGIQGYIGKREGVTGSLKLKLAF